MFGAAKRVPKGPRGQKRPADVIGNAVRVMEIATGQRDEEYEVDRGKDQGRSRAGPAGREGACREDDAGAARGGCAQSRSQTLAVVERMEAVEGAFGGI